MTLVADISGPHIDYKALSPLIAVLGGALVVLMIGLLRSRFARHVLVPALTAAALATAIGLSVWIWSPVTARRSRGGAGGGPAGARHLRAHLHLGHRHGAALAARRRRARGRPGEYTPSSWAR